MTKPRIAIIGAGLSGLIFGNAMKDKAEITVFEKARGVGGRMATRYADPYQFDHGAQFFIAKTKAFQNYLKPLEAQGVIAQWDARFAEYIAREISNQRQWSDSPIHYVGTPRMNSLCKYLAEELEVKIQHHVAMLVRAGEQWQLMDKENQPLGHFDFVVSSAPAEQTAALFPHDFAHHDRVKNTHMLGCYSLMLGFDEALELPFETALVKEADISWMSVSSSKPHRDTKFSLVALATNKWAEENIEADQEWVKDYLLKEVTAHVGHDVSTAPHQVLHRWRYANIGKQQGEKSLYDAETKLAAIGDWCIQGRVESAFTSAMDLVSRW